jgi:hypothetical protein
VLIVDITTETLVHAKRLFDAISLTQANRLDDRRDHEHVRLVVFDLSRVRAEERSNEWSKSQPGDTASPSPLGACANPG